MSIVVLVIALGACSGSGEASRTLASCEAGACECVFTRECPEPLACVDGRCRSAAVLEDVASDVPDVPDVTTADVADSDDVSDVPDSEAVPDVPDVPDVPEVADSTGPEVVASLAFGETCVTNTECVSGYCLDSPSGGICTRQCEELAGGCPEDWVCKTVDTATDPVSLCAQDDGRLCLPCEEDAACGSSGRHLCLEIGGGRFCGRDCSDEPCPDGYRCEGVNVPAGSYRQCVPDNGTCDCTAASAGREKACTAENDAGLCFGVATCDPARGFVGCTARVPEPEVCNGRDDDCDGTTDEAQASGECARDNTFGRCVGVESCQGALGRVCSAPEPAAETCDERDDDCDGETDEDFRLGGPSPRTVEHCGTCGDDCNLHFAHAAEVACDAAGDAPVCVLVRCAPGYIMLGGTCVAEDATLCSPCAGDDDCFGTAARCLSLSDTDPRTFCGRDCSGDGETSRECPVGYRCDAAIAQCLPETASCDCTASNEGQLKACTRVGDAGTCYGLERCDGALGWVECSAPTPAPETCNGKDDDCDGSVDEGLALGDACAEDNAFGRCEGVTTCAGAAGIACTAPTPAAETCNGKDDDCDGSTDEGFGRDLGATVVYDVSDDHCGACGYACPDIAHGTTRCDGSTGTPRCVAATCDEGYYPVAGAPSCLPVPRSNQCAPCTRDADCQGPGDRCVGDGDARVCARDCGAGAIYATAATPCSGATGVRGCCPADNVCTAEGAARVCRPRSGACACTVEGATVACEAQNALGTCLGVRTCSLASGLGACDADTPAVEVCNDLDDDCDGRVDGADDSLDVSTTPSGALACGSGTCTGQWRCIDGAWDCSARDPVAETCDTLDNDCDGQTDEAFRDAQGRYTHGDHCGGCGIACDALVANATVTTCALIAGAPECRATACAAGTYLFEGGRACLPLPDNLCVPCQDDADCLVPGSRCLGSGADRYCARSCGGASPYGSDCPLGYACSGGADPQCVPVSGSCQCGPDTLGVTRACSDDTCAGLQTCEESGGDYAFSPCDAEGVVPEVCDGDDNDCDGTVDEGFVDAGGDYTLDIACGGCGNNCLQRWSAEQHAIGACSGGAAPVCVIGACTSGGGFEYLDTNALPGDGCECQRVTGTTVDEPDLDFGGARPTPDAVYHDADCDGLDGDGDNALFVRAGAAAPHLGTLAHPFATLSQALGAFAASGKRDILVAGGEYRENIVLAANVRLHGGYATDFRRRNIVTFETRIVGVEPDFGQTSPLPGVVYAAGITSGRTIVSGFTIVGYDVTTAPAPGAGGYSSYAVYVVDCSAALELRNNRIVGGRGGPGGAGTGGANGYGRAGAGGTALDGLAGTSVEPGGGVCTGTTCNGGTRAGGAGGQNAQCAGANGIAGGSAHCPVYGAASWTPPIPGKDGAPGYAWTRDSRSGNDNCTGHLTEAGYPTAIKKLDGLDGAPGAPGGEGLQGLGCGDGEGVVVGGHWSNVAGGTGVGGAFGARGGAGAPSGGVDTAPADQMPTGVLPHGTYLHKLGAGGGGAGAGGCGGAGGIGGGSGGASLAVFIGWVGATPPGSAPIVVDNLIERGLGGDGGAGGYGGAGGVGGNGGPGGGSQDFWVGFRAGNGGRGGNGGEGGGGGGGCGGASFGIGVFAKPPALSIDLSSNDFVFADAFATGGRGGAGGLSGLPRAGARGVDGLTANLLMR